MSKDNFYNKAYVNKPVLSCYSKVVNNKLYDEYYINEGFLNVCKRGYPLSINCVSSKLLKEYDKQTN